MAIGASGWDGDRHSAGQACELSVGAQQTEAALRALLAYWSRWRPRLGRTTASRSGNEGSPADAIALPRTNNWAGLRPGPLLPCERNHPDRLQSSPPNLRRRRVRGTWAGSSYRAPEGSSKAAIMASACRRSNARWLQYRRPATPAPAPPPAISRRPGSRWRRTRCPASRTAACPQASCGCACVIQEP